MSDELRELLRGLSITPGSFASLARCARSGEHYRAYRSGPHAGCWDARGSGPRRGDPAEFPVSVIAPIRRASARATSIHRDPVTADPDG